MPTYLLFNSCFSFRGCASDTCKMFVACQMGGAFHARLEVYVIHMSFRRFSVTKALDATPILGAPRLDYRKSFFFGGGGETRKKQAQTKTNPTSSKLSYATAGGPRSLRTHPQKRVTMNTIGFSLLKQPSRSSTLGKELIQM